MLGAKYTSNPAVGASLKSGERCYNLWFTGWLGCAERLISDSALASFSLSLRSSLACSTAIVAIFSRSVLTATASSSKQGWDGWVGDVVSDAGVRGAVPLLLLLLLLLRLLLLLLLPPAANRTGEVVSDAGVRGAVPLMLLPQPLPLTLAGVPSGTADRAVVVRRLTGAGVVGFFVGDDLFFDLFFLLILVAGGTLYSPLGPSAGL